MGDDGSSQNEMAVVTAELRSHGRLKDGDFNMALQSYVPMMLRFLGKKAKLVDDICQAWLKGNI